MRVRHLEKREPDDPVFRSELQGVRAMVDGYVLDEVPDIGVLFTGQPVVCADLCIRPGSPIQTELDLRETAVERGHWVVAADSELAVYRSVFGLAPTRKVTSRLNPTRVSEMIALLHSRV